MKAKTEKPETYTLTEKEFTNFAKGIVCVPKKEVDKLVNAEQQNRHSKEKRKA